MNKELDKAKQEQQQQNSKITCPKQIAAV